MIAKYDDMQNCNFCKAILMLIIVLYHAGMFWTGNWFDVIQPIDKAPVISIFVKWLATFHIYAFTLISGYVYYFVRYHRGGYDDKKRFIVNKFRRLIVPYIFICVLWVLPLSDVFFHFNAYTIVTKYVFGEAPSQLWFLLMLFGVFMIAYPLSDTFISHPVFSAFIVFVIWMAGTIGGAVFPNIFQIFTSLQYVLYFWIGFEIKRRESLYMGGNYLSINKLKWGGVGCLALNLLCFVFIQINPFSGFAAKLINIGCAFTASVSGAIMAFLLLLLLARNIDWQTPFLKSLSKASFPIYLFHQQIIYIILWQFNGMITPWLLMIICFITSTLVAWGISIVVSRVRILRPIIGLKLV